MTKNRTKHLTVSKSRKARVSRGLALSHSLYYLALSPLALLFFVVVRLRVCVCALCVCVSVCEGAGVGGLIRVCRHDSAVSVKEGPPPKCTRDPCTDVRK